MHWIEHNDVFSHLKKFKSVHLHFARHGGSARYKFANKIIEWKPSQLHDERRPCPRGGSKQLRATYATVSDYCASFLDPIMDEVFAELSSGLQRSPAVSADKMIVSKIKPCKRRVHHYHRNDEPEPWLLTLKGPIPKLKDLGVYIDLGVVVSCNGHEMVGYMTPSGKGEKCTKWTIKCYPPEKLLHFIQRSLHDSKRREAIIAQITVLDGLLPLKRAYVACHEISTQCSCLPWFESTLNNI